MKSRRILYVLGFVGVGLIATAGFSNSSLPSRSEYGHSSPPMARVTWLNGESRTLHFEGVGCNISMCSRVRIQSQIKGSLAVHDTWLESVASIKDITAQDARFLFRDGTARRLPIVSGNQFLYLDNDKVELGKFKSVEFVYH